MPKEIDMEFTESQVFEAFGLEQPADASGKEPEIAEPAATEQASEPSEEGAKEQAVAEPAADEEEKSDKSAGEDKAENKSEDKAEDSAEDEQQRRDAAARRRRQERQEAIDQAVQAALTQERERSKGEWAEFFKKAKLKNTLTGADISSLEEFNKWEEDFSTAQLQQDLKAGKLTPEALERAIAANPSVKRAEELLKKQSEAEQQRESERASAKIEAEIAEIHKLDPSINEIEDLMKMPNYREFYEYVKRGNGFLDAYYLANREALSARTADAARQQALANARGKEHLTASSTSRGAGSAYVPKEDKRMFQLFNPDASEAEITAYYNKYKKTT